MGGPVSREAFFTSPVTQRLLAAARARPGLTLSELRESVSMSWGSLYRLLQRLEAEGLVRYQVVGRRKLLFVAGEPEPLDQSAVMEAAAILRQPTARLVALSILMRPGRSVPEVAASLQLTPRVVYHHVQRLIAVGLILSSSQTRHRDLAPTHVLAGALDVAENKAHVGVRNGP
jgi:DNA-binding MarR family transcriptional regulator